MSLYNALFGQNVNSEEIKSWLDLDGQDKKWPTGRFRDIYLAKGGSKIILLTQNGGGQRTWCKALKGCKVPEERATLMDIVYVLYDVPRMYGLPPPRTQEDTAFFSSHVIDSYVNPLLSSRNKKARRIAKQVVKKLNGKEINKLEDIMCKVLLKMESKITVHDKGCLVFVTKNLQKHPQYVRDWDDKYGEYAYFEFNVAEEYLARARVLCPLGTPDEPSVEEKFEAVAEQIRSGDMDPKTKALDETFGKIFEDIEKS